MDDRRDYYHADGNVKFKIFGLTLTKLALTWYKSLPYGSMDFLSVLCEAFADHFNVMKRQLTTMDILSGVKKKTLRGYIDRFTKVEVVVGGSNDILKCWI